MHVRNGTCKEDHVLFSQKWISMVLFPFPVVVPTTKLYDLDPLSLCVVVHGRIVPVNGLGNAPKLKNVILRHACYHPIFTVNGIP